PHVQGDNAEHADTNDCGTVADRCGDKGRLDEVLTHGEQALGDGLVTDCIGKYSGNIRGTLIHECIGREEALLLRGYVTGCDTGFEHARTTGGEEDNRDNDRGCTEHSHDLTNVGHDGSTES